MPRRSGRKVLVALHVGGHALVATAPEPVAARAEVVRRHRALEARNATDEAAPIPRSVLPARALPTECLEVASLPFLLEAGEAATAEPARAKGLEPAAGDTTDPVAEEAMVTVGGEGRGRRVPPRLDEEDEVERVAKAVGGRRRGTARRPRGNCAHLLPPAKFKGPRRSTASRCASRSGCR
jgi:hypothetical protein